MRRYQIGTGMFVVALVAGMIYAAWLAIRDYGWVGVAGTAAVLYVLIAMLLIMMDADNGDPDGGGRGFPG